MGPGGGSETGVNEVPVAGARAGQDMLDRGEAPGAGAGLDGAAALVGRENALGAEGPGLTAVPPPYVASGGDGTQVTPDVDTEDRESEACPGDRVTIGETWEPAIQLVRAAVPDEGRGTKCCCA